MKLSNLEIYERVFTSHWFLTSYNGVGFVFDFPKIGGGKYITQIIYLMENQMCRYVYDKNEFETSANFTSNKLINNHNWRKQIYKKIEFYTKHYFEAGEKLRNTNLAELSDKELVKIVKEIINFQHFHQTYAVLANGVVLDGRNHFSDKIRAELKNHIPNKDFEQYWTLLTQVPKMSFRQEKDSAMAKLASKTKDINNPKILKELKSLHYKYCWLDYNNMGPEASFEVFKNELLEAKKNNKHLKLSATLKKLHEHQKSLIKKLKLSQRARFLITLARGVIEQKALRKDIQYHGFYCYEYLLKEIAKRKNIKNWQLLFFLFPWEVESFISTNKISEKELLERKKLSVFIISKETGLKILIGKKAMPLSKKIKKLELKQEIKETKGQCAFEGKVVGRVKIIQTPHDMQKMQKGDILLSQATSPDLLPAIHKAKAIVTNTGGLICHAAIISRELKIPCIVGTTNVTLIFKDGDMVEVDAGKGIIKKIS